MGASRRQTGSVTLARYTDPHGRPHRVVLRGWLVLDIARRQPVRVVARLGEGEGEPQARALLEGSEIDAGYLARAAREPRPFIRALQPDDLHRTARSAAERAADRAPEDGAADRPLAA